jgi:hypothetical protein
MVAKFILELQKGVSVLIEADSVEEAKKLCKQQFGNIVQETSEVHSSNKREVPKGLYGNLVSLKEEGFFSAPRSLSDIKEKLKELTVHYPSTTFPPYLNRLIQERILRRYQENKEGKKFWVYVNA